MRKALYILAGMSDRDFEWLIHVGRSQAVSEGTILVREGGTLDALYIILDGSFSVLVDALGNHEIARLEFGEVVGEISLIDSRPPSATVQAREDALVWAIPRSQLTLKLTQDVTFSSHFYKSLAIFLSDRLRKTLGRLGYERSQSLPSENQVAEDLNPDLFGNLELAQARLEWLLQRLKNAP